ncbi:hypothetical protein SEA_FRANCOB_141 [Streptomyces phage Francob]
MAFALGILIGGGAVAAIGIYAAKKIFRSDSWF